MPAVTTAKGKNGRENLPTSIDKTATKTPQSGEERAVPEQQTCKKVVVAKKEIAAKSPQVIASKGKGWGASVARATAPKRSALSEPKHEAEKTVAAPMAVHTASAKPAQPRKRLAKAFKRPLDKIVMQTQVADEKPGKKNVATVRDGFTFPETEHEKFVALKKNLADRGIAVTKSQLVRAGIILLSALSDDELAALVAKIPAVK